MWRVALLISAILCIYLSLMIVAGGLISGAAQMWYTAGTLALGAVICMGVSCWPEKRRLKSRARPRLYRP